MQKVRRGGTSTENQRTEKLRGYLREEWKVFSLTEPLAGPVSYHYHEFHKLILLEEVSGEYVLEGMQLSLRPGDVLCIPAGVLHRPGMKPGSAYRRTILYVADSFLPGPGDVRDTLFQPERAGVLRPGRAAFEEWKQQLTAAGAECGRFAGTETGRARVLLTLGQAARVLQRGNEAAVREAAGEQLSRKIMAYCSEHLTEELSIDALAEHFYLSRYYLMHLFRQETGLTVHGYVRAKRLYLANSLIGEGAGATEACYASGFRDYSAFARAYRQQFGSSPGLHRTEPLTAGPENE